MKHNLEDVIWSDKKRYFGLPISFTDYYLTPDRIFCENGIFSRKQEQVMIYRVKDFEMHISFGQRLLGVGDVKVISSDASMPVLVMENVRNPRAVKELVYGYMSRARRNIRATEMLGTAHIDDGDHDHPDE